MFTRRVIVSDSSQISELYYDVERKKMRVIFKTGDCYEYKDFEAYVFGQLVVAESVGSFFSQIKSSYVYDKVKM